MLAFAEHRDVLRDQPTYVILGVQGSGTNLISRILSRAFGVSVVRDRSLVLGIAGRLSDQPSQSEVARAMDQVYRSLFPNSFQRRFLARQWFHQSANYSGIEKHLNPSAVTSPAEFADFFYDYHAYVAGRRHKAIKSDDCWQHLDRMSAVLPNRRYIYLVRDPRDNALSIMNKDFGPRTVYTAAQFVKRQLRAYSREVQEYPDHAMTVHYETLLSAPHRFVEEFSEFAGLESSVSSTELPELLRIRSANHSKWKKLSPRDIGTLESQLKNELLEYGYELGTNISTPLQMRQIAGYRAKDILLRFPQRLKSIWEHNVLAR